MDCEQEIYGIIDVDYPNDKITYMDSTGKGHRVKFAVKKSLNIRVFSHNGHHYAVASTMGNVIIFGINGQCLEMVNKPFGRPRDRGTVSYLESIGFHFYK